MVVLEELVLGFRSPEFHTHAHLGPRGVKPVFDEALENATVNMRAIGRCPVPIARSDQDGRGI